MKFTFLSSNELTFSGIFNWSKKLVNDLNKLASSGIAGASAYDVAVSNGFVGTEADWLASLVGVSEPGEPGEDGDPGAPGQGVPTGGAAGQYLRKASDDDYDGEWGDIVVAGYAPLTAGTEPLAIISDGQGQAIMVAYNG